MSKFKIYLKSILIPVIVGAIVGFITSRFIDYNSLVQPPLAPPSILFPIVWSILYVLMGVSYGILESNSLIDSNINTIYYIGIEILFYIRNKHISNFISCIYIFKICFIYSWI